MWTSLSRTSLNASIAGLISFLVVACLLSRRAVGHVSELHERLSNQLTVLTIGAVVWPIVWYFLVGPEAVSKSPLSVIGLVWTPCLLGLDMLFLHQNPEDRPTQSVSYDANGISSLAFALGSLLVTNIGKNFARAASPLLSSCIFLICAFVLPSFGTRSKSAETAAMQSIQKVALSYCIGLLLSTVGINLQVSWLKYSSQLAPSVKESIEHGTKLPPDEGSGGGEADAKGALRKE